MKAPTPEIIISTVANYYHISKFDLIGNVRDKEFVKSRHIAMWLIKKYTDLSLKAIGQYFIGNVSGDKSHSDVIHAVKSVTNQMSIYASYQRQISELLDLIDSKPEYILQNDDEVFMENDCYK